jgi:microsomal epoxide hydrolase
LLSPGRSAAAAISRSTASTPVPVLNSRYFRASDGVRLHVLEASAKGIAADAPVLAFVPGWSMPASIWSAQLLALSRRYRVAALDPRGQGRSDIPVDGYTLERRTRDIAEFAGRYPKVVLIGWSLGALECLNYVHVHGHDAVRALVLVDSSVGEQPPPKEGSFTEALGGDRAKVVASFVRAIFRSTRPPEEIRHLVEGALRLPLQASIDLLSYPKPREYWRDIAWAFRKPLLYVVTPQFAEQAKNLQRNRPGTRIEVFERAGHALFVDEPQRFDSLIEDFVRGLP